jgi:enediyne biosynthesis protein E4
VTRRPLAFVLVACGLVVSGCGGKPSAPPAGDSRSGFVDVTAERGVTFRHWKGAGGEKQLPETMGGGATVLDFDGDGRLDLFFPQGAPSPGHKPAAGEDFRDRMLRNDGHGRFSDATDAAHCSDPECTFSAAAADYDGDGDSDLFLCNLGKSHLLRNDKGVFTDVTDKAGLECHGWAQCAAFADFDRDGDLDLFVGHYVAYDEKNPKWCGPKERGPEYRSYCKPDDYPPEACELWRNNGDGTFTDVSKASGITASPSKCLGVLVVDDDNDGDADLYVANDSIPCSLWRNDGKLTFHDVAVEAGCAVGSEGRAQSSMGIDATDVEGDGDFDLVVTNYALEWNDLYVNEGRDLFRERGLESGLGEPSIPFLGFGVRFLDVDQDGDDDVVVANGHVIDNVSLFYPAQSFAQPAHLYLADGKGHFGLAGDEGGAALRERHVGRALATLDVDDDGDLDLLFAGNDEPARLLENRFARRGSWIGFRLFGTNRNKDAIGARVTIKADGRTQMHEVRGACSYDSWCDQRLLFGIGAAREVESAEVRWPCGSSTRLEHLAPGRYHEVRELP